MKRRKHASYAVERRRCPKKRQGFELVPTRSVLKCDKKSRCEGKASDMRREHERYAQQSRALLAWAADHVDTLGEMLTVWRSRRESEVCFANVSLAVLFSISSIRT